MLKRINQTLFSSVRDAKYDHFPSITILHWLPYITSTFHHKSPSRYIRSMFDYDYTFNLLNAVPCIYRTPNLSPLCLQMP